MAKKPNIKLRLKRPAVHKPVLESPFITDKLLPYDLDSLAEVKQAEHFRPRKQAISIRLDADVLDWFKSQPGKYQSKINKACRVYMRLCEMEDQVS